MKLWNPQTSQRRFWDMNLPPSFHGLRLKVGMSLQGVYPDPRGRNRKGFSGTSVMPVLSQMIRARDVSLKDALWASVKTPVFSHQSLKMIVFDHIKTTTQIATGQLRWQRNWEGTDLPREFSGTAWQSDRQTVVPLFLHGQTVLPLRPATRQYCQEFHRDPKVFGPGRCCSSLRLALTGSWAQTGHRTVAICCSLQKKYTHCENYVPINICKVSLKY